MVTESRMEINQRWLIEGLVKGVRVGCFFLGDTEGWRAENWRLELLKLLDSLLSVDLVTVARPALPSRCHLILWHFQYTNPMHCDYCDSLQKFSKSTTSLIKILATIKSHYFNAISSRALDYRLSSSKTEVETEQSLGWNNLWHSN